MATGHTSSVQDFYLRFLNATHKAEGGWKIRSPRAFERFCHELFSVPDEERGNIRFLSKLTIFIREAALFYRAADKALYRGTLDGLTRDFGHYAERVVLSVKARGSCQDVRGELFTLLFIAQKYLGEDSLELFPQRVQDFYALQKAWSRPVPTTLWEPAQAWLWRNAKPLRFLAQGSVHHD